MITLNDGVGDVVVGDFLSKSTRSEEMNQTVKSIKTHYEFILSCVKKWEKVQKTTVDVMEGLKEEILSNHQNNIHPPHYNLEFIPSLEDKILSIVSSCSLFEEILVNMHNTTQSIQKIIHQQDLKACSKFKNQYPIFFRFHFWPINSKTKLTLNLMNFYTEYERINLFSTKFIRILKIIN
eukprot:TRINITY_DN4404_c0_g1_i2.p1 TRINITY_DN4404_c0_g1~~TRINITY_DN4404_c0_g1_i2.p1  ORF type:complete len:180 (+),score=25.04 TRINITY_DN4404_c0_g1_i2:256-795(+)